MHKSRYCSRIPNVLKFLNYSVRYIPSQTIGIVHRQGGKDLASIYFVDFLNISMCFASFSSETKVPFRHAPKLGVIRN
jgi:hypothetical protein